MCQRAQEKKKGGNIRKEKQKDKQGETKKNRLNVRLLIYLFFFSFPACTANSKCRRALHKRLRQFIGSFLPQAHSPEKQKMMNV
jgi:hypothetical protein